VTTAPAPDGGRATSRSGVADGGIGYACIAEQRSVETITRGNPSTPFLKFGDRVRIEMLDKGGASIFGPIDQQVVRPVLRGPGR